MPSEVTSAAVAATSPQAAPSGAHRKSVAQVTKGMLPPQEFSDLADLFRAMGTESRAKILHALSMQELCVGDIATILGATDSAVSHQLRYLRSMRLVRNRREGKMIYYALDDDHVRQLFEAAMQHVHEQRPEA